MKPKVFVGGPFSAAMAFTAEGVQFDRRLRPYFEIVHENVRRLGWTLWSAHIAESYGCNVVGHDMVQRDNTWVRDCDLYIALLPLDLRGYPYRSDGTFVELGLAMAQRKKVIIAIEGLSHPGQSFYVRHIGSAPDVFVFDWEEFFKEPQKHMNQVIERQPPLDKAVDREHTTDADEVLRQLGELDHPHKVVVRGTGLTVLPGVFSPQVSHSADFMIENWNVPAGAKILDLGCGSGILGLFSLLGGGGHLTAVDINPQAVLTTRLNLKEHGFAKRSVVLQGDAYSALASPELFDVILLSPPYWNRKADTTLARACFDDGYRFLSAAVRGARARLKKTGHVFLSFADQGDTSLLTVLVQDSGLYISRFLLQRPTIPGGHVRLFYDLIPSDKYGPGHDPA